MLAFFFTFLKISDIITTIMSKKELHPKDYRDVVFSDEAAGFSFLTKSTAKSEETIKWEDGKEYPLVKVQISSASHPFFTARAAKLKTALESKAKKAAREAEKKAKAKEEKIIAE